MSLEILPPFAIAAGETKTFGIGAQYIEVIAATDPIDIVLTGRAGGLSQLRGVVQGTFSKEEFTGFTVTSATAQNVTLLVASREAGTRRLSGAVSIIGTPTVQVGNQTAVNSAFAQTKPAVTNASANLLVANANRRYLLIQNLDPLANVFVRLDGVAATVATGIQIPPGGSMELATFATNTAVTAIADQATADVRVVEG